MRVFGWCYIFSVVFSLDVVALASVSLVCSQAVKVFFKSSDHSQLK